MVIFFFACGKLVMTKGVKSGRKIALIGISYYSVPAMFVEEHADDQAKRS
jgi:hypothetical protein